MGKGLIVLFAALAVAMVAAGCGEDSSTASPTKAQFVKQANAACKKSEAAIQADFAAYLKGHKGLDVEKASDADYEEIIETILVPNAETEIDEIRALGAPSGDEDQVDAMLVAREESIEVAEDEPKAVIKESDRVFGEASKLAGEYGLDACDNR